MSWRLVLGGVVVFLVVKIIKGWMSSRSSDAKSGSVIFTANAADLKDGEMKELKNSEAGASVLLIKENGEFSAIGAKCPHKSAPLVKGVLAEGRVRCPWHGACFNSKTGDIEEYPGNDSVHSFPVNVAPSGAITIEAELAKVKKQWKRCPSMCSRDAEADSRTFVIVGGGPAGLSCAETLRRENYKGKIVMIGKEEYAPYDRTVLSKGLRTPVSKMLLRPDSFYVEHDIKTHWGCAVTSIDHSDRKISLDDGSTMQYDECFVATGGSPRLVTAPGSDLANIYPLRVPSEAHAIAHHVEGKNVVIVGSSFIGMETASVIHKKAASVTVVGMESVCFERVLGADIGVALERLHKSKGIAFRMRSTVDSFGAADGDSSSIGSVTIKSLEEGGEIEVIPADLVVMGAGVIPSTQLFKTASDIEILRDQSIAVDQYLSVKPHLYLGGDIARYPFHLSGALVRIEHLAMAQFHGKTAALNMLNPGSSACTSIPFFWTTQYGKSVRYCGHAHKYDQIIIDGDVNNLKFVAYFCDGEKVLAAASVGRDPSVSLIAELMHNEKMLSTSAILKQKEEGEILLAGKL